MAISPPLLTVSVDDLDESSGVHPAQSLAANVSRWRMTYPSCRVCCLAMPRGFRIDRVSIWTSPSLAPLMAASSASVPQGQAVSRVSLVASERRIAR